MVQLELVKNNKIVKPDFILTEKIGTGGFGSIYKIEGNFDLPTVIKFGNDEQLINEYSMYNILSKIIPHNIPKCYEFGECRINGKKQYYIIIEYIEYTLCEGDNSLHLQISNDAIIPIYMNIFNELVDIIDKIHQHGFVHRDIKPSNILIKQLNGIYIPVLIDFGLLDTIIHINGDQIYYAGTRCYSSIFQHFGIMATPIDDFINLVYTWMKVFSTIHKQIGLTNYKIPWDAEFIRQNKKKHEFYAYEKWKYLDCYDSNNFFDRVLQYLYNLQHFWTTNIVIKKIYYIDPLQRFTFDIHTITEPPHWKKLIKQESLNINKYQYLSPQLKNIVCVDNILAFVKHRLNYSTKVNIADYSLVFMRYMMNQYNILINDMWEKLKSISSVFMNKSSSSVCSYMYNWLFSIQKSLNKDIKVFEEMLTSVNIYTNKDIFTFFNYRRIQVILQTAIEKLPKVENMYSYKNSADYLNFYKSLTKLYNRDFN